VAALWKRSARLVLNDVEIDGLRLRFKVKKTLKPDPNTLDLYVYNLAEATRARLQAARVPLVLVGGYDGATQVLFAGESRAVDHLREGAAWVTHVQCGDGEKAFREHSSFSVGAGAKLSDVIARIAGDLGVNAGDAIAKIRKGEFPLSLDAFLQGYAANGRSVRELDRVMKAAGLEWSIQDGVLQILPPETATQEEAIVLSPDSGLVGSPDHKMAEKPELPPLLKVQSLLNGGFRPGRALKMESATRTGFYRVENVEHAGDTHGREWTTTLEARPL
jgi:hypothetical protein